MNRLEKHVQEILLHMQTPPEDSEDIKEELMEHLEAAKRDWMEAGYSEKEAEQKAIHSFGKSDLIGNGMQEALYPYQRGFLYMIGLSTLIYGMFFYLSMSFYQGQGDLLWLIIQTVLGAGVTWTAINISYMAGHFWSLNVIVLLSAIWNGFNVFVVEQLGDIQAILFSIYLVAVVLISFIFIIRNSYFSSNPSPYSKEKRTVLKISYIINVLFGIILCGVALFFSYGLIIFAGYSWILVFPFSLIGLWLLFFRFQMKYIPQKPVRAIALGLIFLLLITITPIAIASL
ncbi:permease prefix domain 1-containing protein [Pontibacillus salicampi]|uniref:Permease prefix domain 1-containing protein n=1 Tax=Pontibacillus salicampi TaxID=1449801 RepID=A0ABV6LKT3_9BACI